MHYCFHLWMIHPKDDEETTVTKLSTALATVLRDNPEVAFWITHHLITEGPRV